MALICHNCVIYIETQTYLFYCASYMSDKYKQKLVSLLLSNADYFLVEVLITNGDRVKWFCL